ncbi:hypothetical protein [Pseudomonas sp. LB1P83]
MEIIILFTPLVLGTIVGLAVHFIKAYISKLDSHISKDIFLKLGGATPIKISPPQDIDSFMKRMHDLQKLSPQLAIIDGWNSIHQALVNRVATYNSKRVGALNNFSEDIFKNFTMVELEVMANLDTNTIRKIDTFRKMRNMIVHQIDTPSISDEEMRKVAGSSEQIINSIGPEYLSGYKFPDRSTVLQSGT